MKKTLIADINSSILILSAFDCINPAEIKLLSQVNILLDRSEESSIKAINKAMAQALLEIEEDIGVIEEKVAFYFLGDEKLFKDLSLTLPLLKENTSPIYLSKDEAREKVAKMILEEVGDILILDVTYEDTSLYLLQQGDMPQQVKVVISNKHKEYKECMKYRENTAEELVIINEQVDYCLKEVVNILDIKKGSYDLCKLRWVIGTGEILIQLPDSMELVRTALTNTKVVDLSKEFPVLIDQYNILLAIGALSLDYRNGSWQLLLETLGVV